jgi:hypothetical protein
MEQIQAFLGVEDYLSKEKFVVDPKTGFYCFEKGPGIEPVCLPEDKVNLLLVGIFF